MFRWPFALFHGTNPQVLKSQEDWYQNKTPENVFLFVILRYPRWLHNSREPFIVYLGTFLFKKKRYSLYASLLHVCVAFLNYGGIKTESYRKNRDAHSCRASGKEMERI